MWGPRVSVPARPAVRRRAGRLRARGGRGARGWASEAGGQATRAGKHAARPGRRASQQASEHAGQGGAAAHREVGAAVGAGGAVAGVGVPVPGRVVGGRWRQRSGRRGQTGKAQAPRACCPAGRGSSCWRHAFHRAPHCRRRRRPPRGRQAHSTRARAARWGSTHVDRAAPHSPPTGQHREQHAGRGVSQLTAGPHRPGGPAACRRTAAPQSWPAPRQSRLREEERENGLRRRARRRRRPGVGPVCRTAAERPRPCTARSVRHAARFAGHPLGWPGIAGGCRAYTALTGVLGLGLCWQHHLEAALFNHEGGGRGAQRRQRRRQRQRQRRAASPAARRHAAARRCYLACCLRRRQCAACRARGGGGGVTGRCARRSSAGSRRRGHLNRRHRRKPPASQALAGAPATVAGARRLHTGPPGAPPGAAGSRAKLGSGFPLSKAPRDAPVGSRSVSEPCDRLAGPGEEQGVAGVREPQWECTRAWGCRCLSCSAGHTH